MTPPWLLLLAAALPPALIALVALDRTGRYALLIAAAGPLPALWLAATGATGALDLSWLLLGMRLQLDEVGRVFLLLTALLWFASSLYAHGYLAQRRRRFAFFWLLSMSGNLVLVLAADAATFYLGFAVMSFAVYGLVIHDGTPFARRAGRVYIVMVILGEAMLLPALLYAVSLADGALAIEAIPAAVAGSTHRNVAVGLLVGGFGVKAGLLVFHLWLPLAHPAAPVPASAALSGAMIKAGLLGWLRFLPLGEAALETWGAALVVAGVAGALLAVLYGVFQDDPKVNLAYSSISQIGLITMIAGVGLAAPAAGTVAIAAAAAYALHHGLAKATLFLGVGLAPGRLRGARRWLLLAGLALPAAALAGAPFTSGAVAKGLMTTVAGEGPPAWEAWLLTLLPVTSVATTVLLGRYLLLVATPPQDVHPPSPVELGAWFGLLVGVALLTWFAPPLLLADIEPALFFYPAGLFTATWPVVAGAAIVFVVRSVERRRGALPVLPAGDLAVPLDHAVGAAPRAWAPATEQMGALASYPWRRGYAVVRAGGAVVRVAERSLARWSVAGTLFLVLLAGLIALLARG